IRDQAALDEFIRTRWLTDDAVRFYALVIGEGWRFPEARQFFWNYFDFPWRKALGVVSGYSSGLNPESIELYLDHQLLNRLRLR
ncbi:MAG: hypothetical protein AAF353_12925, partial [Pseudomonadota bacterium]